MAFANRLSANLCGIRWSWCIVSTRWVQRCNKVVPINRYLDTPRWLHGQGRREEAIAVLSALRCLPPDDDALQREYADMAAALELEREAEGSSWSDVFRDNGIKGNRRVLYADSTPRLRHSITNVVIIV